MNCFCGERARYTGRIVNEPWGVRMAGEVSCPKGHLTRRPSAAGAAALEEMHRDLLVRRIAEGGELSLSETCRILRTGPELLRRHYGPEIPSDPSEVLGILNARAEIRQRSLRVSA